MNFFGHATVALHEGQQRGDPLYVLGAMLPDFASMAGLRLAGVDDPVIAAGVGLHHRTDDAFHGAATFIALVNEAQGRLEASGLAHGSAMAVAHVGVELLLDGCLFERVGVDASYHRALAGSATRIRWRQADGSARLELLRRRLIGAPLPDGYRDPDFVAARLHRILAARPRLALAPAAIEHVHAWARTARASVADAAAALMDEVRVRLRS